MYLEYEDTAWAAERLAFQKMVYLACEIGGFVLLMTFLPTYFYRAYRRWYALPEA